MRLTPAQLAVHLICGLELPMRFKGSSLKERLKQGKRMLTSISGRDFGYDLRAWHDYLKESRDGGYTWNKTIVLPKIMKEAMTSENWQCAIRDIQGKE